jgi:glycosyltransferase involved in cell wall biosynthesis
MPSRFEAYGIALVEALVAGLPSVTRAAFAMAEIVEDGVTGALVDSDEPDELAEAVGRVLHDGDSYRRVAERRPELLARHSWPAVASTMVEHMASVTGAHR